MNYTEEQLMEEIQKVGFAVIDLKLYLDINPTDRSALMSYNQYANQLRMLKEMYSRNFRQIDQHAPCYQYPFSWICPLCWPWMVNCNHMCKEAEV